MVIKRRCNKRIILHLQVCAQEKEYARGKEKSGPKAALEGCLLVESSSELEEWFILFRLDNLPDGESEHDKNSAP